MTYFMGQRWTRAQASGIVANLMAESGMNPTARPRDGSGSYGLGQWRKDRLAALFQFAQARGLDPTAFKTQLVYAQYELTQGGERAAGNALRAAATARQASQVVSTLYERRQDTAGQAAYRGDLADQIASSTLGNTPMPAGAKTTDAGNPIKISIDGEVRLPAVDQNGNKQGEAVLKPYVAKPPAGADAWAAGASGSW